MVIIEYNGTFPPPLSIVLEFTEGPPQKIPTDYFGASLAALAALGTKKGYELHEKRIHAGDIAGDQYVTV